MIEKEDFEEKTFILVNPVGQGQQEYIFPINLEGFLSTAKVRDMNS